MNAPNTWRGGNTGKCVCVCVCVWLFLFRVQELLSLVDLKWRSEADHTHCFISPKESESERTKLVKNLPSMQETPVQFLGREDSLEKV